MMQNVIVLLWFDDFRRWTFDHMTKGFVICDKFAIFAILIGSRIKRCSKLETAIERDSPIEIGDLFLNDSRTINVLPAYGNVWL